VGGPLDVERRVRVNTRTLGKQALETAAESCVSSVAVIGLGGVSWVGCLRLTDKPERVCRFYR